jgi:hypothetical protein
MRLDEVPDLVHLRPILAELGIDDVRIREVNDDQGPLGWVAVVILFRHGGPWWATPVVWRLPARPSYEGARTAVTALLEGIAAGQNYGREYHPPISRPRRPMEEWCVDAEHQILDEWRADSRPSVTTRGRPGSRPPRANLPAGVPWPIKEWGKAVGVTRARWDWTQSDLGEMVGLDRWRISKIERGVWLAPDDIILNLSDILDLEPPAVLYG